MASALAISPSTGQEEGAQVTFDDQQKINKYARKTSKLTELMEEINNKKKELQKLEDAAEDLLMVDDDAIIPYQIGESFLGHTVEDTQALVETAKEVVQKDIEQLEEDAQQIRNTLSELKVQLYAKFGNSINLEMDDA
ncbi:prefoldin subunit 4-like isoform X2 [Anneissia japonica]|uniref:prefoldin subunit 4-like isoform X2 n=1 Tax=Anneissia japonica TaxID=1529436 RepID=UPI0014255D1C|nr:prefoldin subunit 4-like isoform X2 [Anneissia japonica]